MQGTTNILQRIQYGFKVVKACSDTIKGLLLRYRWNFFLFCSIKKLTMTVFHVRKTTNRQSIRFVKPTLDNKRHFKYITNGTHLTENSTCHNRTRNKSFAPWLAAFILFIKKENCYILEVRTPKKCSLFSVRKIKASQINTSTLAMITPNANCACQLNCWSRFN